MYENEKTNLIKPGMFGMTVAADTRRQEFDFFNEQNLYQKTEIDYLFLGDSITHWWNLHAYFQTDKYLENRGIGGDTSQYLLRRLDADCIQLHPKCVIIMIGTNDITRTEPDLWWKVPGESTETVLSEYKDNIRKIIEKCDAAGIETVLCSVLPSKIAPPFNRVRRWEMTRLMNEYLQSLGKVYVDYHGALSEDGKTISDSLSPDGIHPSAKAYAVMAKKLGEVLGIRVKGGLLADKELAISRDGGCGI